MGSRNDYKMQRLHVKLSQTIHILTLQNRPWVHLSTGETQRDAHQ